jgi:hypothetical protein
MQSSVSMLEKRCVRGLATDERPSLVRLGNVEVEGELLVVGQTHN